MTLESWILFGVLGWVVVAGLLVTLVRRDFQIKRLKKKLGK